MNKFLTLVMLNAPAGKRMKQMKKIVAVVLGMLCLAGCGKRGNLDFPDGAVYPRQYPSARQPKQGRMMPVDRSANPAPEDDLTKTEE